MPPGGTDIPAKGGTTDFSWLIWDRKRSGPTLKRWWVLPTPAPPVAPQIKETRTTMTHWIKHFGGAVTLPGVSVEGIPAY